MDKEITREGFSMPIQLIVVALFLIAMVVSIFIVYLFLKKLSEKLKVKDVFVEKTQ